MHPSISYFPSAHFYQSRLQDDTSTQTLTQPYYNSILQPYQFFNVSNGYQQTSRSMSYYNDEESLAVVQLLEYLVGSFPQVNVS